MLIRDAASQDVLELARLHAESWRSAYRGILSDGYLENEVYGERLALWQKRLFSPPAEEGAMFVILAEEAGRLVGFSCAFPRQDAVYGSFLDNLHVRPGRTGSGIGSRLLRLTIERLEQTGPGAGLYLWVLEKNHRARRFYRRHGAQETTPGSLVPMPDGQSLRAVRCHWPRL